jgi:D-lyxose ketol-isomerase
MSILVSASLVKAKIFIPPFNKWNKDTEDICRDSAIELVKFEDGWKCAEYNKFDPSQILWYLHHREFTSETFKRWLNA